MLSHHALRLSSRSSGSATRGSSRAHLILMEHAKHERLEWPSPPFGSASGAASGGGHCLVLFSDLLLGRLGSILARHVGNCIHPVSRAVCTYSSRRQREPKDSRKNNASLSLTSPAFSCSSGRSLQTAPRIEPPERAGCLPLFLSLGGLPPLLPPRWLVGPSAITSTGKHARTGKFVSQVWLDKRFLAIAHRAN